MARLTGTEDIRAEIVKIGTPVWLHAEPDSAEKFERHRVDDLNRDFDAQVRLALRAAERNGSGGVLVKAVVTG